MFSLFSISKEFSVHLISSLFLYTKEKINLSDTSAMPVSNMCIDHIALVRLNIALYRVGQ